MVMTIGGVIMAGRVIDSRSQTVEGVAGYREFTNRHYEPYFTADLPSNWILEEYPLTDSKGRWISLRGPANESQPRCTSLDLYLIERGNDPRYESLEAFVAYTTEQESIGETSILLDRRAVVAGLEGREIKISSQRVFPGPSGAVDVTIVKQWTTLMKGDHVFVVFYESPQEDFDSYFAVYQRVLGSLNFM
jgi:hypothetical protein